MDDRALGDARAHEVQRRAFRMEDSRDGMAVALANDNDALALAVLVDRKAPVAAVLFEVRGLDVAAEIAAVDFDMLAFAADHATLHFFGHGLAQLVEQHEGGLVGRAQFAGHSESALALHLIGEQANRSEIDAQRQLVRSEESSARHAEILRAGPATEARRTARPAAVVGVDAATVRATRLAVRLRPANAAKRSLGLSVRHAEDASEGERLGGAGKEKMLSHVTTSDDVIHRM